jgi:hypothetical protein
MNRAKSKKSRVFIYVIVAAIVLIAVVVFRYLNPSLGFKYFEPSYLPPGVSVKQKRISIAAGRYIEAEQDFRMVDWVYEITEYKAGGPDGGNSIGSASQNYSTESGKPTCDIISSSKGQQYRLCHWVDYGRTGVYEVKFIKDRTFVDSEIPTTLQQKLTINEISLYVDSFKSAWALGMPVLRSNF